jgi:RNA polymerase sigma factor (sigma-70 family)
VNDLALLALLKSGEQLSENQALLFLFRKNIGPVRQHVLRNMGTEEEAMELLQDSLVALFFNARKDSFALTAKLDTYLFAIAKNLWFKQLRKKRAEIKTETYTQALDNLGDDVTEGLLEQETGPLQRLIAQMSLRCKEVLSMIFVHELGIKEIKERLDYASEQAVRNKKSECLGRLREMYLELNKDGAR